MWWKAAGNAPVGELLGKLAELGIERETLVIFTSDNGPWPAMRDGGGSAGGLRGGKTQTFFEGGIACWGWRAGRGSFRRRPRRGASPT